MEPAARLRAAYDALRRNQPAEALQALDGLGLEGADQGRVHAWRAQALRALARPEEAAREVIHAIRVAKSLGDEDGVRALRALHTEISASVASLRAAAAGRAADAGLRELDAASLDADTLLRKASAHADAGEDTEAARIAALAVERADTPRDAVLARLALARHTHDPALLHAAHSLADDADDPNLLTAVAHAARALGVSLARPSFG